MKRFGALYTGTALLLGVAFFTLMRVPMRESTLELDLWWMVSAISSLTEGKSAGQMLRFILAPEPMSLEPPVLKAFLSLTLPPIGLKIRHLVLILLLLHGANALLLRRVLLQLRLGRRAAFLTACSYFTLLAHFHAFLWAPAIQHLFAVFTVLSLLHLYLKTEERIRARSPGSGVAFGATLAVAGLASVQRTALVGSILILTDLMVGSRGREERALRYRRWFPLFALSLFYPAWILSAGADAALVGIVLHSGLPERARDLLLPSGATGTPFQSALKYPAIFSLGLAAVGGLGALLQLASRRKNSRIGPLLCAGCLILGGFVLGTFQDKRQLLLPYNALVPVLSAAVSFLWPLETALRMGAPEPAHFYIPPQISLLGVAATLVLLVFFCSIYVARKRSLVLFFVWYLVSLVFILKHQDGGFPPVLPSRYFAHLSPCAAVVLCSVGVWAYLRFTRVLRVRPWARELALISFFAVLCVLNLIGIRLASWKGKLANTYYAYEDLRIARLLMEDLGERPGSGPSWVVRVEGVEPLLAPRQIGEAHAVYPVREGSDNLQILLREQTGPGRPARVLVQAPGPSGDSRRYVVHRSSLVDSQGRSLDPFERRLEEGFSEMKAGRWRQAVRLLEEASVQKPFLLNYCLGPGLRMEDLRWLTGGAGFRSWMRKIDDSWRTQTRKFESIRSTTEEELADYASCFLALSWLEAQSGNEGKSRYWLSQLGFLEWDREILREWLGGLIRVRELPALREHLGHLKDPGAFSDPLPWRKDDYGFGRFLLRFLCGLDLRSEWGKPPNTR